MDKSANRSFSFPEFHPASVGKRARFLGALTVLIVTLAGATELLRAETWTDATGKFTIEAEFVGVQAGEIYLKRKSDGVTIKVPFKQLSAASQQLARKIYAATAGAKPEGPGGDSPEATMQALIKAMETGNLRALWDFLPPSYQKDVNGQIHTFAATMDTDLWRAGTDLLNKGWQVLEQQKTFAQAYPAAPGTYTVPSSPEIDYDLWVDFLKVVASELADLNKLKTLDVGAFLEGSGSAKSIVEHKMFPLLAGWPKFMAAILKNAKYTTLRQDADTATLRAEWPGNPPRETKWVRVEGKWLSQEIVGGWTAGLAEAKTQLAAMGPQLKQNKQQVLTSLTAANKLLDRMLTAKTQQEFNHATDTLKDLLQKALPEGPSAVPLVPRANVPVPQAIPQGPGGSTGPVQSGNPLGTEGVRKGS